MFRGGGQPRDFQDFLIIQNHTEENCFGNSNVSAYTDVLSLIYEIIK